MNSYTKKNPTTLLGFSLLELMVVVAIVAILAGLTYPTFSELIAKNQTETAARQLNALLLKAQTESLRRGGFIQLEKFDGITGSNSCNNNNDWSCGLRLMADADKNGSYELVLDEMSIPKGVRLLNTSMMIPSDTNKISFDRWGKSAKVSRLSFVQSKENFESATRAVCMESTGRVYTIKLNHFNSSCP
jgi:prepilin-type N-terminal cleavage/methylation domain-containing protein